jgi:hypothetical protein
VAGTCSDGLNSAGRDRRTHMIFILNSQAGDDQISWKDTEEEGEEEGNL